jgi:UPF0271 protein
VAPPKRIKLPEINCDLGEGCANDSEVFSLIDVASLACGGHTGSAESIDSSLQLAAKFKVKVGAHPSYADKENFGRLSLSLSMEELEHQLDEQLSLFLQVCRKNGVFMDHIKFHGALYNDAAASASLADTLTSYLKKNYPATPVLVPPHSMMHLEVRKKKLPFRLEVFADRCYLNTYHLAPRSQQGALLTTLSEVATQVAQILEEGILTSLSGERLAIQADTLCFHGDNPGIMEFLPQLRKRFWK